MGDQNQALASLQLVPFGDVASNVVQEAHDGLQQLAERLPALDDESRCGRGSGGSGLTCCSARAATCLGGQLPDRAVVAGPACPPAAAAAAAAHQRPPPPPPHPTCLRAASASCCCTCRPHGSACSACTCVRSGRTRPKRSMRAGRCSKLRPTTAQHSSTRVSAAAAALRKWRACRADCALPASAVCRPCKPTVCARRPNAMRMQCAADELFRLHEELRFSRAPLFDVPTALHILQTGGCWEAAGGAGRAGKLCAASPPRAHSAASCLPLPQATTACCPR